MAPSSGGLLQHAHRLAFAPERERNRQATEAAAGNEYGRGHVFTFASASGWKQN